MTENGDQERWASGNADDREGDPDCDDIEPNVDDDDIADMELSFGWSDDEATPSLMAHRAEHEGE